MGNRLLDGNAGVCSLYNVLLEILMCKNEFASKSGMLTILAGNLKEEVQSLWSKNSSQWHFTGADED